MANDLAPLGLSHSSSICFHLTPSAPATLVCLLCMEYNITHCDVFLDDPSAWPVYPRASVHISLLHIAQVST